MPVLHDRVRRLGDGDGPVLSLLFAVGSADSGRAARRWLHRHCLAHLLLVRHRAQHCRAHLTVRQRGSHPAGPVLPHQLGPANV